MIRYLRVDRLLFNGLRLHWLEGRTTAHFVLDATEYIQVCIWLLGRGAGTVLIDPHNDALALWLSRLQSIVGGFGVFVFRTGKVRRRWSQRCVMVMLLQLDRVAHVQALPRW